MNQNSRFILPFIHPSIYSFIHPSMSVSTSTHHLSITLFIRLSIRPLIRPSLPPSLRWPEGWRVCCICCVGFWGPEGGLWWRRTGSQWNCRQEERCSQLSGGQEEEKQIRLRFIWLLKICTLLKDHTSVFECFSIFTMNLLYFTEMFHLHIIFPIIPSVFRLISFFPGSHWFQFIFTKNELAETWNFLYGDSPEQSIFRKV